MSSIVVLDKTNKPRAVLSKLLRFLNGPNMGITLALYSAVVASLSSLIWWSWGRIVRRIWTEIDVDRRCEAYKWLQLWLAKHQEAQSQSTRCALHLERDLGPARIGRQRAMQNRMMGGSENALANDNDLPKLTYVPRLGETALVNFDNRWVWLRELEETNASRHSHEPQSSRIIRISVLFKSIQVVTDLIMVARQLYQEQLKTHTVIWTAGAFGSPWGGSQGNWNVLDARPSRPMDTVVLEGGIGKRICDDVKQFIESEEWYYARGVPYRRGYLLYGPPGCGKTSFITALAGELHMVICIVNLASKQLTDDTLLQLMGSAPRHSILLLEDVDAAFRPESDSKDKEASASDSSGLDAMVALKGKGKGGMGGRLGADSTGITFSGLLNAIDGVAAQEGKVLFMTTNHLDRLDEALVRPGRVDVRGYFGLASQPCARQLFLRFYYGIENMDQTELESIADEFSAQVPDKRYTMATIQSHLMDYRHTPKEAVEQIEKLHASASVLPSHTDVGST